MLCDIFSAIRAESTRPAGLPTRSSTVRVRTVTLGTSSMISETTLNGSRRKSHHHQSAKPGCEADLPIRQTSSTTTSNTTTTSQAKAAKKQVSYSPFEQAMSKSNPFEGLKRNETRDKLPALVLGILGSYLTSSPLDIFQQLT